METEIIQAVEVLENDNLSIWFWIALIEFIIVIFLLLKIIAKSHPLDFAEISKKDLRQGNENPNMQDLFNSIANSKNLYKELSKHCHPDKFAHTPLHAVAEEIFQDITRHKRDYKRLTELKAIAIDKLNINF